MHILIVENRYAHSINPHSLLYKQPSHHHRTNNKNGDVHSRLIERRLKTMDEGFTFSFVWNGKEALDYLANPSPACPRPNMIFMKISLPVMGGYEAVSILRTQLPFIADVQLSSTPIIAMMVHGMRPDYEICLKRGFDDVIFKPIPAMKLRKIVMYWSARRVVPRNGVLQGPPTGGRVPIPSARAEWGLPGLRGFWGPRSLL